VWTFTATTRAPAIGAPPESVTYPRMLPVLVCAAAPDGRPASAVTDATTRPRRHNKDCALMMFPPDDEVKKRPAGLARRRIPARPTSPATSPAGCDAGARYPRHRANGERHARPGR